MEAMIHIETGKPVDLSRENLIDCSVAIPNHYCKGGNAVPSFAYIANCGLYSTADYPYTSAGVPVIHGQPLFVFLRKLIPYSVVDAHVKETRL